MWKVFGPYFVEAVRLAVVLVGAAVALRIPEYSLPRGIVVILGAGIGYVVGGLLGRWFVRRTDVVERQINRLSTTQIIAGTLGLIVGGVG